MNQSQENEEREIEEDDIHENHEPLLKVDLANRKISISQDMPLDIENYMMSETLIHFKEALVATIDEVKCIIKFLKSELEEKTLTHSYTISKAKDIVIKSSTDYIHPKYNEKYDLGNRVKNTSSKDTTQAVEIYNANNGLSKKHNVKVRVSQEQILIACTRRFTLY